MRRLPLASSTLLAMLVLCEARATDPLVEVYAATAVDEVRETIDGDFVGTTNDAASFALHVVADGSQDFLGHQGTWKRKRKNHYRFVNSEDFSTDLGAILQPGQVLRTAKQICPDVLLRTHVITGPLKYSWTIDFGGSRFRFKAKGAFVGSLT